VTLTRTDSSLAITTMPVPDGMTADQLRKMKKDDLLDMFHDMQIDVRRITPACPETLCNAPAGIVGCRTKTGYPHGPVHRSRLLAVFGIMPETTVKGSKTSAVPSRKAADVLTYAAGHGGLVVIEGTRFRGDAQWDTAVRACADDARGWLTRLGFRADGETFEITNAGRSALARYQDKHGGKA
jgi:hypothetical protein